METPTGTERLVYIHYVSRHKLFLPECERNKVQPVRQHSEHRGRRRRKRRRKTDAEKDDRGKIREWEREKIL